MEIKKLEEMLSCEDVEAFYYMFPAKDNDWRIRDILRQDNTLMDIIRSGKTKVLNDFIKRNWYDFHEDEWDKSPLFFFIDDKKMIDVVNTRNVDLLKVIIKHLWKGDCSKDANWMMLYLASLDGKDENVYRMIDILIKYGKANPEILKLHDAEVYEKVTLLKY